ncbi:MAG: hypothetical protein ACJ75G_12105 [Gaiellaceae bacterium]
MRLRGSSRSLVVGCAALVAAGVAVGVWQFSRSGPHTFTSETTRLETPPPLPLPGHRRHVASARAFADAVEHARPGDRITVTGDVRIPGEFTGFDRVVPGRGVDVVLGPQVRFTGGRPNSPAVFVHGAGGWRIWGGTITNRSGDGILVYALPGPFRWVGFRVHDTAGTCVSVLPVGGNIDRLALRGVTGSARPDLALDPHSEPGTGIHAWNIGDAAGGLVENSTFAADVVSQATGAAVQIDTSHIGPRVTVYARARRLGFAIPGTSWHGYARRQVAGNVVQLWGGTPPGNLDLRYVEGADIQGRLVDESGVTDDANLGRVHIGVTRATGPILESPLLSGPPVQLADGIGRGNG